jgi:membrane protease YdiL (CAAX protease family)
MAFRKSPFPWLYLALSYGLAWMLWIPVALTGQDYQESPLLLVLVLLGIFGPGIAGIVLTYREGGREGGRRFWASVLDPRRIRPMWVLLIVVIWPAFHGLAIVVNLLLGHDLPTFEFLRSMVAQPLNLLVVPVLYLIQAALEELGWRGYMQDRVQARWSPTVASLVIGLCHALWHLPLFWIEGTNQKAYGFGPDFWLFIANVLAAAVYSTWCYNANRRSTLVAILMHFWYNLCLDLFVVPGQQTRVLTILVILGGAVIWTVWRVREISARRHLERQRPVVAG